MNLLKPFKALGYPILPVVPECTYCSAMRFSLFSSIITGSITGFALGHTLGGLLIGVFLGLVFVLTLYGEFKWTYGGIPPAEEDV